MASLELARALLAAALEVRPLLAPELGRRLLAKPPLAADPVPVARRAQLPEHREHARLHSPAHQLVRWDVLAPPEVVEARARIRDSGDRVHHELRVDRHVAVLHVPAADRAHVL